MTISNAQLAQQMSDLIAGWNAFMLQHRQWLAGTITGGFNADGSASNNIAPNGGYYPLNDGVGNTYYVKCPAKQVSDVMKGDKGNAADADISFFMTGLIGPSERFMVYDSPISATYDMTKCQIYAENASAGTAIIQLQKALQATPTVWTPINTITFSAGVNKPVVSAGNITLAAGDRLGFFGPSTMDGSLSDITWSLPGTNVNPGP